MNEPKVGETALRHGISELDMLHAYRNAFLWWQLDEGMEMPKSTKEILEHRDALLADTFESYEPNPADQRDGRPYQALRAATQKRADAESEIVDAVAAMRGARWSWASIGGILGTSGQAAQQRYGKRKVRG